MKIGYLFYAKVPVGMGKGSQKHIWTYVGRTAKERIRCPPKETGQGLNRSFTRLRYDREKRCFLCFV